MSAICEYTERHGSVNRCLRNTRKSEDDDDDGCGGGGDDDDDDGDDDDDLIYTHIPTHKY
jgi:hypothetical protein